MNDVTEGMIKVLPLASEDLEPLKELAAKENHTLLFPTHVIWKNDRRVGWFSIANVPIICGCLSTTDMKAMDSMQALNVAHNTASALGFKTLLMPLCEKSPFFDCIERFGYKRTANQFTHFFKEV